MVFLVDESYREILLSLQLVPELLQLDTRIVIVPGTAPTICQSLLLLLADDPHGAAARRRSLKSHLTILTGTLFFWFVLEKNCRVVRTCAAPGSGSPGRP